MLEERYENKVINRQYWLAQALIQVKSYTWSATVDYVAARALNDDIDAFYRVVAALNAREAVVCESEKRVKA